MDLSQHHLDQQDVVLLIAAGADGSFPLDPIRLMKGCFLVSQLGTAEWKTLFNFRPYDYGPFDSTVYSARDALVAHSLLAVDWSNRYGSYSLTDRGRERVQQLRQVVGDFAADWFTHIGRYVTDRSFTRLLDEIYAKFPDYATRSRYSPS